MNSSYKIALLVAGLLCAIVVGYYALPGDGAHDPADGRPDVAANEPAPDADDAAPAPRRRPDFGAPAGERRDRNDAAATTRRAPAPLPDSPATEPDAPADDALAAQPTPTIDPTRLTPAEPDSTRTPAGASDDGDDDDASAADEPESRSRDTSEDDDAIGDDGDDARIAWRYAGSTSGTSSSEPASASASASDPDTVRTPSEPRPDGARTTRRDEASRSPSTSGTSSSTLAGPRRYTVVTGDTLSSIAEERYGHERYWIDIAEANPTVDPLRLRVGQELRLPGADGVREDDRPRDREVERLPGTLTHTVRAGETLSTIAARHYDDASQWRRIFNANRDMIGPDPNRISAGDELTVPPLPSSRD